MGSMMDDINKFSKIWDDALKSDIFKSEPKQPEDEEKGSGADFFGNYLSPEYDIDRPLNEEAAKDWSDMVKIAGQPLLKKGVEYNQKVSQAMGAAANPVYPYSVGKDQEIEKWDNFCQKLEQLDQLKKNLHKLESSLNEMMSKNTKDGKEKKKTSGDKSVDTIQTKINKLSKEINDLSDLVTGRFGASN